MSNELKRWTGEVVGAFGMKLAGPCGWEGCGERAVFLPCNAEGDKGRAHHHGGVHDLSEHMGEFRRQGFAMEGIEKLPTHGMAFCETHGLLVLASNNKIRAALETKL